MPFYGSLNDAQCAKIFNDNQEVAEKKPYSFFNHINFVPGLAPGKKQHEIKLRSINDYDGPTLEKKVEKWMSEQNESESDREEEDEKYDHRIDTENLIAEYFPEYAQK
jgi:hypothetical protein